MSVCKISTERPEVPNRYTIMPQFGEESLICVSLKIICPPQVYWSRWHLDEYWLRVIYLFWCVSGKTQPAHQSVMCVIAQTWLCKDTREEWHKIFFKSMNHLKEETNCAGGGPWPGQKAHRRHAQHARGWRLGNAALLYHHQHTCLECSLCPRCCAQYPRNMPLLLRVHG